MLPPPGIMAATAARSRASLLFLFALLLITPLPSFSFSFSHYHTLFSLSHSLTTRVANLRASRGDFAGEARAQAIARKLEAGMGLGFWWKLSWTMGWDYFKNYAWTDVSTISFSTLASAVSDLNELLRALNELSRADSETERVAWVSRNYKNVLSISESLFGRLLKVFRQSGALREVVEALQKEVVDGELLRDCLEVGTDDLKGLIQIFKDIALQNVASTSSRTEL